MRWRKILRTSSGAWFISRTKPDPPHLRNALCKLCVDADATFSCITQSLTRFMAWDPPANRRAFDLIWQDWLTTIAAGTDFTFAIRDRHDGRFLGLTGLHQVQNTNAELGIWIREDCHGQGFGREAASLVARWASLALRTCHRLRIERNPRDTCTFIQYSTHSRNPTSAAISGYRHVRVPVMIRSSCPRQ
ncbi:GNAT family N-acetyltransferase [Paraburkholderia rhizosphaerae]|uniref:GNAT family N-acetyltransferase n=1 Tax=Paraburkholderia rhizosphaerae TaxID=480658 RepID=UPI002443CA34|nr:GNAT family N-acetyltransferase [Paraburkholderia rhizosphaerae]